MFLSIFSLLAALGNSKRVFVLSHEILNMIKEEKKENILISLHGLNSMMRIFEYATQGKTKQEIEKVITNLYEDEKVGWHMSTGLWINKDIKLRRDFVTSLYKIDINYIDFKKNDVVAQINSWIDKQSKHNFKNLVQRVNKDSDLLVSNTLYVSSSWNDPFDKKMTKNLPFAGKNVPFLQAKRSFYYSADKDFQLIEIGYVDNLLLLIALPVAKLNINKAIELLTYERFEALCKDLEEIEVDFALPKFKLEDNVNFKDIMVRLGIQSIFYKGANWGEFAENKDDIKIDSLIHRAKFSIDELGSLAQGYVVPLDVKRSVFRREVFHANRPFLFFVTTEYRHPIMSGVIRKL